MTPNEKKTAERTALLKAATLETLAIWYYATDSRETQDAIHEERATRPPANEQWARDTEIARQKAAQALRETRPAELAPLFCS